jgi:hypothetical protein
MSKKVIKKRKKNVSGLKKWNKIVSIIVKDYKKNDQEYDLSEVRKLASQVYAKDFKDVAPSRMRVGKVKKTTKEVLSKDSVAEITAKQLRDNPLTSYYFLDETRFNPWFKLGEWVQDFVNTYPNVPTMIVTKANYKTPLIIQGAVGTYSGGIFQNFIEEMRNKMVNYEKSDEWIWERDEIDDEIGEEFGYEIDTFMADAIFINGQWYAVWFEASLLDIIKELLEQIPPKDLEPQDIDERTQIIVDIKEEDIADTRKKRKLEKKKRTQKIKPKKPSKPKKKPTTDKKEKPKVDKRSKDYRDSKNKSLEIEAINKRLDGLRKDIETLKEEVKDGFLTKAQAKKEIAEIRKDMGVLRKKLEKGGRI